MLAATPQEHVLRLLQAAEEALNDVRTKVRAGLIVFRPAAENYALAQNQALCGYVQAAWVYYDQGVDAEVAALRLYRKTPDPKKEPPCPH